jgi:predicted metal-dependent hydrolase
VQHRDGRGADLRPDAIALHDNQTNHRWGSCSFA